MVRQQCRWLLGNLCGYRGGSADGGIKATQKTMSTRVARGKATADNNQLAAQRIERKHSAASRRVAVAGSRRRARSRWREARDTEDAVVMKGDARLESTSAPVPSIERLMAVVNVWMVEMVRCGRGGEKRERTGKRRKKRKMEPQTQGALGGAGGSAGTGDDGTEWDPLLAPLVVAASHLLWRGGGGLCLLASSGRRQGKTLVSVRLWALGGVLVVVGGVCWGICCTRYRGRARAICGGWACTPSQFPCCLPGALHCTAVHAHDGSRLVAQPLTDSLGCRLETSTSQRRCSSEFT